MILTGIIESYATLALCCLVSFYTLRFDSYGQIIQSASCLIFAAIVVYMPIMIYRLFTGNFESLSGEKTTQRYGFLYEEMEMKQGQKLYLQPTFFLVRRLLLCLVVTCTSDNLFTQIIGITAQSIIAISILTYVKPYRIGILKVEIFNEVILVLLMYTIMCLSKFVPSIELKFQIGYVAIGLVGLHLLYHMSLMTVTTIRTQIIKCKKWRRFRQYKFQRAALQKRLKKTHE